MKVYLIRHGETEGNLKKQYIGRTNESLCSQGIQNIKNRVKKNYYPDVELVVASPMKRCLETTKIIYPDKKKIVIDGLAEMNFGCFEGKDYLELSNETELTGFYKRWVDSNCELPIPGGESKKLFIKRSLNAFNDTVKMIKKEYKNVENVAFIVHGGTIMSILSDRKGGDFYSYHVDNGEYLCCTI